jgi:hypothetical protein
MSDRLAAARRHAANRTHACPGRCGRDVPDRLFSCPGCWGRLPRDLQRPITGNRRGTAEHFAAMGDALTWYREHEGPKA